MNVRVAPAQVLPAVTPAQTMALSVLLSISFSHMLNDLIQSLIPSIYPMLKTNYDLSFGQIGFLTLTFQITASLLQPVVGTFTDKRPMPFSLPVGMGFTLVGLLMLSQAHNYPMLLLAAALVGMGSSVFHPESSRVARMASGGRHGLAQSVFQVGGNAGQAIGPLAAAFVVMPHGQGSVAIFAVLALLGMAVLYGVGRWYSTTVGSRARGKKAVPVVSPMPRNKVILAVSVLLVLIFSKYFYTASLASYYTFYLIERFHVPVQDAQVYLFLYLGAFALGTLCGGPVGDRIGRKYVIWASILGVLPFTLVLPYANLFWTVVLTIPIGLVLSSAFSAILVYAQELMPGRIGTVSGLFFGFAFGMGGLGAAVLGQMADHIGITAVYHICAFLPAIGLLTAFLPNIERPRRAV
jgi:FSR family fosmidomycin resistance protein-like MFS transporter